MLNSSAAARAQGIQWTRPFLTELCDEIRQALEAWAGEPEAGAPNLQQARAASGRLAASLQTLDAAGAAGLAEALAQALEAIDSPDQETATVLLESVAILPDYLERLEAGAPDLPEVLAGFISRTRAAAGLDATPESSGTGGIDALNDEDKEDFPPLDGETVHRGYQRALRDWLRDHEDIDGLIEFAGTLQRAPQPRLRRLGKVAGAAFKGLAGGQLEPGPQLQAQLAALDQLLRRLRDRGDEHSLHAEADKIARGLLEYLQGAAGGCPEIDRIRAATGGGSETVDPADLARARSVLSGRNRELFTAIAEAARGELNQAKEALNEFLLGRQTDGAGIGEQAGLLRSVAESFGMLGLERLRRRVRQQADRLGELTADPENPVLLDVARELLLVESELDEAVLYLGEPPESDLLEGGGQHLPTAEHRRVMRQLLGEALDDLGQAKHLLDQVHRGQSDADSVEQAMRILRRVAGVLFMAGQPVAAELLEASAACVGDEMAGGATEGADSDRLEGLAEALVVVDFYLDGLTRLDDRGAEYLHDARTRLIDLGYLEPQDAETGHAAPAGSPPPKPEAPFGFDAQPQPAESTEAAEPELSEDAETLAEIEAEGSTEAIDEPANADDEEPLTIDFGEPAGQAPEAGAGEPPGAGTAGPVDADADADADVDGDRQRGDEDPLWLDFDPSSDPPKTVEASGAASDAAGGMAGEDIEPPADEAEAAEGLETDEHGLDAGAREAEPSAAEAAHDEADDDAEAPVSAAGSALDNGDFDLMSIFLEEFDEEFESLTRRYPEWRKQPTNESLLIEIRRSFHTLKGSGRMAGAERIGEFAWEIEQLLNQTLDGQYTAEQVIDPVGQAIEALPSLRAHLLGDSADLDVDDIDALLSRATGIGQEIELPELEGLDPTLVKLMVKEINDHLETIDRWIETSLAQGWPADADRDLIRAVHTIKGTLRLAPIGDEAESMQLIEEYLQEVLDTDSDPAEPSVELMEDLRSLLGKRLDRLERRAVSTEHFDTAQLAAQARSLISALHREVGDERPATDSGGRADETGAGVDFATLDDQTSTPGTDSGDDLTGAAREAEFAEPEGPETKVPGEEITAADEAGQEFAGSETFEEDTPAQEIAQTEQPGTELSEADTPGVEIAGEEIAGEEIAGEEIAGEDVFGEEVAREEIFGEESAGDDIFGEETTGEETTGEETTGEETTGEETTGEETTGEETTGEETTGEETTGEETTGEETTGEETTGEETTGEETTGEETTGEETTGEETTGEETTGEETTGEETTGEETTGEEITGEEITGEEITGEEITGEEITGEEITGEETTGEETTGEETTGEETTGEETTGEETTGEETTGEETTREETTGEDISVRDFSGKPPLEPAPADDAGVEFEAWPESESDAEAEARSEAESAPAPSGTVVIDYGNLDSELLALFVDEGQELLEHSDELLQQWRESPGDRQLVTALQRDIHTIKGSARMAGLNPVGEVAHVLEDLLENIAGGRQQATPASIDTLETGCDHLHAMLDAVENRQPLPARAELEALAAEEQDQVEEAPAATRTDPDDDGAGERTGRSSTLRLASEQIEELLNFAGEVSIFRSRIEQQIGSFRGNIGEVEQTIARLRDQLRKLEQETEAQILSRYEREHGSTESPFDPLELDRYSTIQQLSRALAESVSDLNSLTELMDDAGRQSETLLMQQARVNTELQEGLMQARMVSFNTIAPRLRRVVRNAARDIGRKAELQIRFEGESELDRNVLDRVTAPIEHILRNAIAHGIESPVERRAAGKSETGTIAITIGREATELLIRVSDDGAGLDFDRIRERAAEMDLLKGGQADDSGQLSQLIFQTGFSTASEVSELSGRGVGMDVVSSEVRQIGGRISVQSESGRGARFTLRIPLSLAVMQAIFVPAGERLFAIPLQAVRGVARIRPNEWREALDADGTFRYGGEDYPLVELDPQLGFEPVELGDENLSLLMISTGDQRAAVRVADIQGHREIVLKPVGPQISSIPGILGGTIMGDGQVIVLLDMAPLIERALARQMLPGMVEVEPVSGSDEEVKRTPLIMVVDDSITMRRVTARILEHHGLEVITARDGVEAVDLLFERVPDLMLLDIEMPRMDGFELATYVRDDTRLAHVPIMMITSRSGDKHREHARQLGVDRYLIKPYQEANMVRNVFEMLDLPVPGDEGSQ